MQLFQWDDESHLSEVTTIRRPGTEHETRQTTAFDYDAIGRRIARRDAFGTTEFIWEGMRLIEERRGSSAISYVYEPGSYAPLARIDAQGDETEQGGLGAAQDGPRGQEHDGQAAAANDNSMQARYWASLRQTALQTAAKHGLLDKKEPEKICTVYYFHNDINGCPEELTNEQGQIVWQATYKTWGATITEDWQVRQLHGGKPAFGEGSQPRGEYQQQNLRFQGQYLDKDTGLHYNTFRYYDPDIGRFISPDPIGLGGGLNLHSYSPNPISWIDPWGLCVRENYAAGKAWEAQVTAKAQGKYGTGTVTTTVNGKSVEVPVVSEQVRIQPLDANGKPVGGYVVADNVIYGQNGRPIKILDAKASTKAPLTKNQKPGYENIQNNGGVILNGPNAGQTIGRTPVDIINPTTVGKI